MKTAIIYDMNDLYLIGNGFDLAHGLKTSYNDFLLWYLNNFLRKANDKDIFEDDLLKIVRRGTRWLLPAEFNSIGKLFQTLAELKYDLKSKPDFFKKIIKNYRDYKWVDIEYEYYMALVEIYRGLENSNIIRSDFHFSQADSLNTCFESIKKKLIEYLNTIDITSERYNQNIENILLEGNGPRNKDKGDKLYVYFNYTSTLELYSKKFPPKNPIIYIHGKLFDNNNPIIFGYGDEMHPYYEKLENLNSNEFMKNIKSFGYFKTNNYQRIIRFLEGSGNSFTVKIIGHSCGLSDRILLNTIFEHPNCKSIKIYYYQKNENDNDYFEKTQEISRHFKSSAKGNMRNKIISFERCIPLLPFNKQN